MPVKTQRPITNVAVGLLVNDANEVLLGSRPDGKPWSGWWELPGGKLEPGEHVHEALARELEEEIAIRVHHSRPWLTVVYHYPTTSVRLHVRQVTDWQGEPTPQENQQLLWLDVAQALARDDLLPPTYPLLRALLLPRRYLISHVQGPEGLDDFMARLIQARDAGIRAVQWREPQWQETYGIQSVRAGFERVLHWCRHEGIRLLVNSCHPQDWWAQADGVHLRAGDAMALLERPELRSDQWLAISTHDPRQLEQARALEADFAVLGPVLPTESHPDERGLGWELFGQWAQEAGLPVMAIGGQSSDTMATALEHGAHGIAGIRHLLDPTDQIPHKA